LACILLHEAIGHGLEADFNRKKTSAFAGMRGAARRQRQMTVVATDYASRRAYHVDDEATLLRHLLIEKGISGIPTTNFPRSS